jgi:3-oxoacyl-[acyl-carrier-protein] synthase-3
MEDIIGHIGPRSRSMGAATLRKNGIEFRHYALSARGERTHTNAEMAAHAIMGALDDAKRSVAQLDHLATSTTQGDSMVPGFASAVHGELGAPPLELASFQSVCASSLMAVKNAWLNVRAGECRVAAACGSEFSSRWFRPGFYAPVYHEGSKPDPELEFLRWTLSDGAGAVIVEPSPRSDRTSLRIDWIRQRSFADRFADCMYAGRTGNSREDRYWNEYVNPAEAWRAGAMVLRQDFSLLYRMFPVWLGFYLTLVEEHGLDPGVISYFLPHYSAESLGDELRRLLSQTDAMIPEERWFNNNRSCGNTGTASIFIMLEELVRTRTPRCGETILCFVPESGRCICSFMHLTVVEGP